MELNYIKEFVHLANVGNYLTASEDLFVSQSSLSKHIMAIETELGVTLFDRTTRKVKLTEVGNLFLEYARVIADQQVKYTQAIKLFLNAQKNNVTLGVIPPMAQYDITEIIYSFQKGHPDMKLALSMGDTTELIEQLDNRLVDFAFLRETTDTAKFQRIPFHNDYLVAVVPVSHKLAKYDSLTLKQLSGQNLSTLSENTLIFGKFRTECEKAGVEMNIIYQGHHITNIANFATRGDAIAVMTDGQTRFIHNPYIKIVDIVPKIEADISICYKSDLKFNDASKHFLSIVKNFLDNRDKH